MDKIDKRELLRWINAYSDCVRRGEHERLADFAHPDTHAEFHALVSARLRTEAQNLRGDDKFPVRAYLFGAGATLEDALNTSPATVFSRVLSLLGPVESQATAVKIMKATPTGRRVRVVVRLTLQLEEYQQNMVQEMSFRRDGANWWLDFKPQIATSILDVLEGKSSACVKH